MKKEKPESLKDFVVDDARRDWILKTYPPSETGRPGILVDQRTTRAETDIEGSGEPDTDEED